MRYLVTIESFDAIIEEEVIVNINGQHLRCFMSCLGDESLEVGNKYYANIEYEIFNDLIVEEVKEPLKYIQCIDEGFNYNVIGKVSVDDSKLESTIDIQLDEDDLYDFGPYNDKYVKLRVDRFNIEFIN